MTASGIMGSSMTFIRRLTIATLLLTSPSAMAQSLDVVQAATNPPEPQMGDHMTFQSVMRNDSGADLHGVVVWLSLLRIDAGQEQPMDLEDWSALKATTTDTVAGGQVIASNWDMRLIQSGRYRVLINATSRDGNLVVSSAPIDFAVKQRPVVDPARVLPVAIGEPVIILGVLLWRLRRQRVA
jgi:hypothetical protein